MPERKTSYGRDGAGECCLRETDPAGHLRETPENRVLYYEAVRLKSVTARCAFGRRRSFFADQFVFVSP